MGPYIECEQNDLIKDMFVIEAERAYFNLLSTHDKYVTAYSQKKTVKDRANPPSDAKYRDTRNRAEGYAQYRVGKVYFSPDEVSIEIVDETNLYAEGPIFPSRDITLNEMLIESSIITELEKKRITSLILYNCPIPTEQHIMQELREAKIVENNNEIEIVEVTRIGKQYPNKIQPVKIICQTVAQADNIYAKRRNLKASRVFVAREMTGEEMKEQKRASVARMQRFPRTQQQYQQQRPHQHHQHQQDRPQPPPQLQPQSRQRGENQLYRRVHMRSTPV